MDGTCECDAGFVGDGATCDACASPCSECSFNTTTCTACLNANAEVVDGTCVCKEGYVGNGATCTACTSPCATCVDTPSKCTSCISNNASVVSDTCECDSGFVGDGAACESCNSPCLECSGSPDYCDVCISENATASLGSCSCNSGFFGNGAQCTGCNATQEDGGCTCVEGFYFTGSTCLSCDSPCGNCSSTSTFCTSCEDVNAHVSDGTCECKDGFFGDPTSCQSCTSPCETCEGTTDHCLTCVSDHAVLQPDNTCECAGGYVGDGATCTLCYEACATCQGDTNTCATCIDPNAVVMEGSCVCPPGFTGNGTVCEACESPCSECSSTTSTCTACLSPNAEIIGDTCVCKSGFFGDGATCTACNDPCSECAVTSDNCTACVSTHATVVDETCECNSGFFGNNTVCEACESPCSECVGSASFCTACVGGADTSITDGECTCNDGFFGDGATCEECTSPCLTCFGSAGNCTSCVSAQASIVEETCVCRSGFFGDGESCSSCDLPCSSCVESASNCTACANPNAAAVDGVCVCNPGYFGSGLTCTKCAEPCATCSGGNSFCTSCISPDATAKSGVCSCDSGFYGNSSVCELCEDPCSTCSDLETCKSCANPHAFAFRGDCVCGGGFFGNGSVCEACASPCLTCSGNADNCESCESGDASVVDGTCECDVGFVGNGSVCDACDVACSECSFNTSFCTVCSDSNALPNTSGQCECVDGYFGDGTVCFACESPCSTCVDDASFCLSCDHNNSLPVNGVCTCDPGFVGNSSFCEPCDSPCLTCDVTPSNCTSCISEEAQVIGETCECNIAFHGDGAVCEPNCSPGEKLFPLNGSCEVCPAGSFTNSTNIEECVLCPAGWIAAVSNSSECEPCAKGSFAVGEGLSTCEDCPSTQSTITSGSNSSSDCFDLILDAPVITAVEPTSTSNIFISYTIPVSGGPISHFRILTIASTSQPTEEEWATGATLRSTTSETTETIGSLAANTKYWIRVEGVNAVGFGPGGVTSETTLSDPPSQPRNLRVGASGSRQVVLTWDAPVGDGLVFEYSLFTSPSGTGAWALAYRGDGGGHVATLLALLPSTTYDARINARYSNSASGPFSTVLTFTTNDEVPSKVVGVAVSEVTVNTFTVVWEEPTAANPLPITGFSVRVESRDSAVFEQTFSVAAADRSLTVTGLPHATALEVTVTARNSFGTGDASDVLVVTTAATVPGAPLSVIVDDVSDTSAHISWTAPNDGGSSIVGYKVSVLKNGESTPRVYIVTLTEAVLTDLVASTNYVVSVQASNEIGLSALSEEKTITTLKIAPQIVRLSVSDPDNGDAVLSVGDVFEIEFDIDTNRPFSSSLPANLPSLLSWSHDIGASPNAVWVNAKLLRVTVLQLPTDPSLVRIGVLTVRVLPGILVAASSSAFSESVSPSLSGSFGKPVSTGVTGSLSINPVASVDEDGSLPLVNVVLTSDDSTTVDLSLTVSVGSGVLHAPGHELSNELVFTGNVSFINNAVKSLTYLPTLNFFGLDAVQYVYRWTGSATPTLLDIASTAVEVRSVNDAPVITVDATFDVNIDGVFSMNSVQLSDSFDGLNTEREGELILQTTGSGLLRFSKEPTVTISPVAFGTATSRFVLKGSIHALNIALLFLEYVAPSSPGTDVVLLTLTDDGDEGGVGQLSSTASSRATIKCANVAAPVLVSAVLSNSLLQIEVKFDTNVSPSGSSDFICGSVFSGSTVGKFGEGASCSWVKSNAISVRLGQGATMVTGDSISLLPTNGIRRCPTSSNTAQGSVVLQAPVQAVTPVAVLSGPSTIGVCDNLVLDASLSSGLGGRPGSFSWSVSGDNSAAILDGVDTLTSVATISASTLAAGETYTFTLVVTNFLGIASPPVSLSVVVLSLPVPNIHLKGPNYLSVARFEAVTLSATVTQPCQSSSQTEPITLGWSVTSPTGASVSHLSLPPGVSSVRIPRGSLVPTHSYQFKFTVSSKGSSVEGSVSVQVDVRRSPLSGRVGSGGTNAVSHYSDITLDASSITDPDSASTQLEYDWSCVSEGVTCINASSLLPLNLSPNEVVTFPARVLMTGSYLFTVSVSTADGRSLEQSLTIVVSAGTAPLIKLVPAASSVTSRGLLLIGSKTTSAQPSASSEWSIDSGVVNVAFPKKRKNLIVNPKREEAFVPGSKIIFRFEVVDIVGQLSFATAAISVYDRPSAGSFSVSPSSGVAFDTPFELSAPGWEDLNGPLQFSFFFIDTNGREMPLGAASYSNSLNDVRMLAGNPNNNFLIEIGVSVRNRFGAVSTRTSVITVQQSTQTGAGLVTQVETALTNSVNSFKIFSDPTRVIQTALASVNALKAASSTMSLVERSASKKRVLEAIAAVANSVSASVILSTVEESVSFESEEDLEALEFTLDALASALVSTSELEVSDMELLCSSLGHVLESLAGIAEETDTPSVLSRASSSSIGGSRRLLATDPTLTSEMLSQYDTAFDVSAESLQVDEQQFVLSDSPVFAAIARASVDSQWTSFESTVNGHLVSVGFFDGPAFEGLPSDVVDVRVIATSSNIFSDTDTNGATISPSSTFVSVELSDDNIEKLSDPSSSTFRLSLPCDISGCVAPSEHHECICECLTTSTTTDLWSNATSSVIDAGSNSTYVVCEVPVEKMYLVSTVTTRLREVTIGCNADAGFPNAAFDSTTNLLCESGIGMRSRYCDSNGVYQPPDESACECAADGGFAQTEGGKMTTAPCSAGSEGRISRRCLVGGLWANPREHCFAVLGSNVAVRLSIPWNPPASFFQNEDEFLLLFIAELRSELADSLEAEERLQLHSSSSNESVTFDILPSLNASALTPPGTVSLIEYYLELDASSDKLNGNYTKFLERMSDLSSSTVNIEVERCRDGAWRPEGQCPSGATSSSGAPIGLIVGLLFLFLAIGVGAYFGFRYWKKRQSDNEKDVQEGPDNHNLAASQSLDDMPIPDSAFREAGYGSVSMNDGFDSVKMKKYYGGTWGSMKMSDSVRSKNGDSTRRPVYKGHDRHKSFLEMVEMQNEEFRKEIEISNRDGITPGGPGEGEEGTPGVLAAADNEILMESTMMEVAEPDAVDLDGLSDLSDGSEPPEVEEKAHNDDVMMSMRSSPLGFSDSDEEVDEKYGDEEDNYRFTSRDVLNDLAVTSSAMNMAPSQQQHRQNRSLDFGQEPQHIRSPSSSMMDSDDGNDDLWAGLERRQSRRRQRKQRPAIPDFDPHRRNTDT